MTKNPRAGPLPGVAIIGPGNWGASLARALHTAGVLREVIAPPKAGPSSGVGARRAIRGLPTTTLDRAYLDAAILWLCVPDSAIAQVARHIVARRALRARSEHGAGSIAGRAGGHSVLLKGQIVVHSSGALGAAVLRTAARAGASIASVHPVMTFPTRTPVPLTGVPFGIEADPPTRRRLNAIVRSLGGRPFAIAGSGKALYHAVGMLASPLLVSLIAAATETADLAGLTPRQARRLIEPIAQATLKNIFSRGASKSFSGPIARGDVEAIHLHLQALAPHPMVAALYRSLALYALEVLPARNREALHHLLQRSGARRP